jgi:hypothetical protein
MGQLFVGDRGSEIIQFCTSCGTHKLAEFLYKASVCLPWPELLLLDADDPCNVMSGA